MELGADPSKDNVLLKALLRSLKLLLSKVVDPYPEDSVMSVGFFAMF